MKHLPSTDRIQRAAVYIRVSTAEQAIHGKSLQAQMEYLQNYADEHGMKVVGVYADEGQTARKELKKRKAIHQLLAAVERDEVDVILFWRMDRWFRSVSDFYKVQDILDAHNCIWISTSEPNISMETRDGRLNLNLVLAIGQNEVDTTSERIRFTVDNMIQNGRIVWGNSNLPLGFKIGELNGRKAVVKNEEEAPMVEEFFRYFRIHQNKTKTVLHMRETFGIPFTYSRLRTMLSSEFYIGKYRENQNYCPAYLTEKEWTEIQKISRKNTKIPPSGRVYLFSGLICCPLCGRLMAGAGQPSIINRKTGEKRYYIYYRCNQAFLDHACEWRRLTSQNLLEQDLLKNLSWTFEDYQVRQATIMKTQRKKKTSRTPEKIQGELKRLNFLYVKERISFEDYDAEYQRLNQELSQVNASALLEEQTHHFRAEEVLKQKDFMQMYESLDQEHRQTFWHGIISKIQINTDAQITSVDFL